MSPTAMRLDQDRRRGRIRTTGTGAHPAGTTAWVRRIGAGALAMALSVGVLASQPASAATGTVGGASATAADTVVTGTAIHVEGTGWTHPGGGGSVIGVKLDSGMTEPASGPVTNPATGSPATGFGVWAAIQADADGSFSADLDFPTAANSNPAITPSAWAVGTTHHLRLLTGSLKSGDTPRSLQLDFQVVAAPTAPTVTATATTAATGATAGQVTVAVSGAGFSEGDALTVNRNGTQLQWTSGRPATSYDTFTVSAAGTLSANVVFAPGVLAAGPTTLTIVRNGDDAHPIDVPVTVNPGISFGSGTTQGASGTLTLVALPADALVSKVAVGDSTVATGLTADGTGTATGSYTIADDARLGTVPVTVTQTEPTAATYTLSVKVSPDPTPFGTDKFTVTPTADGVIEQGLYQSAYSAASDALFVTTANVTTSSTIYKLNPHTLAVEASVPAAYVSGTSGAVWAAYGVGVDDEHGTVWVTNTRQNTVAVYQQSDLSLVKQFPQGTVTHSRDVAYDAAHDRIFVSSANEGQSGDGYIAVFDANTLEQLPNIAVHPRTEFSPVSLSFDATTGKLWTVSLFHDKALSVDTNDPDLPDTILTLPGLDVGGRGASGVAYDAGTNRLFVASQNNDELLIANATTGATIKEVPTGAGALNVALDPVHKYAYVTNLSSTNVTVVDFDGTKIANLPISKANHVSVDGLGNAYVVNKDTANKVYRISPNAVATAPATVVSGHAIRVKGSGFVHPLGGGSVLGVKLDDGATQPTDRQVVNPVDSSVKSGLWAIIEADATGAFDVELPFPTPANASLGGQPISAWETGSTHRVRLLTGSLKPGDTVRTIALDFTVAAAPEIAGAVPTIAGSAVVGQTLTATPGSWSPESVSLAYQWLRNGQSIQGATTATYTLTPSDLDARISVTVTGSKDGYEPVSKTSAETAAVAPLGAPVATVQPSISGTAVIGKVLTGKPGAWSVDGLAFSYQWLRNGAPISGATKATYQVTSADSGKSLAVRVTASRAGYADGTATSTSVTAGKALTATPTPKVTGTAKVGKTLKAKAGTWKPAKVTVKYQWLRDGAAVKSATKSSYKLTKADAGHKLSVRVTGSKSGYASVAKVSAAKSIAKYKATVKLSVPAKVSKSKQAMATLSVAAATSRPTGTVKVTVNGKSVTTSLAAAANGKLTVALPAIAKKGTYQVKATFSPTGDTAKTTAKSATASKKLKVV